MLIPSEKLFAPFQCKVRLFFETDHYEVKTVESSWELEDALRLRYRVFRQEILGQPAENDSIDIDSFDLSCDHLILRNKKGGQVIGTYRMISSTFHQPFYSSQEFNLDAFFALPGTKLELGRACVHPNFRNGLTLTLLWKGIQRYSEAVGAHYLFGCSSIQTMDPKAVAQIRAYFQQQNSIASELSLPVRPAYRFRQLPALDRVETKDMKALVPPLLASYLKAGARVGSEPALDRAFRCVDFLTILETRRLQNSYSRRVAQC